MLSLSNHSSRNVFNMEIKEEEEITSRSLLESFSCKKSDAFQSRQIIQRDSSLREVNSRKSASSSSSSTTTFQASKSDSNNHLQFSKNGIQKKKSKRNAFTATRNSVACLSISSNRITHTLNHEKRLMDRIKNLQMPRLNYVTKQKGCSVERPVQQEKSQTNSNLNFSSTHISTKSKIGSVRSIIDVNAQSQHIEEEMDNFLEEANQENSEEQNNEHACNVEERNNEHDTFMDTHQDEEELEQETSETSPSEHDGYEISEDEDDDHQILNNHSLSSDESDDASNKKIYENKKQVLVKREGHNDMTLWVRMDMSFHNFKRKLCKRLGLKPSRQILEIFGEPQFEHRRFITVEDLCQLFNVGDTQQLECQLCPIEIEVVDD
ncbi:hypothetical protein C9374_011499 [Naegleria lovaniensis]|uniref:Uncharacterized protein n=1 Tax=Naegleria lovaniensis TaxID=51637 RepID=A0AA88GY85_NAELO|nr:uncharacterized protein C9374_011499 [Naegleria lovaniensis]KAG2392774.1 hypothetical protein C9374_011499 [Naegleria lovaniensis]